MFDRLQGGEIEKSTDDVRWIDSFVKLPSDAPPNDNDDWVIV
jgi:hypothetical protein